MAQQDRVLLDAYGERIDLDPRNDFQLFWRGLRRLLRMVSGARGRRNGDHEGDA